MEEIALVFSSLAGACTAVAFDKIPKRKLKQTATVSSAVENQLHSLNIEKEILTKTITRLHNDESNISKGQRDKLLLRYQHQLGAISAKIEKLEIASKYPDLGPVGDSIISLMDSRLSKLDQRLHEISSKITVNTVQPAPQVAPKQQATVQAQAARHEPPKQIVQEKPRPETVAPEIMVQPEIIEVEPEKIPEPPAIHLHVPERHVSVELSTLTTIPNKMPEFPAEFIKPTQTVEIPKPADIAPKVEVPQIAEPSPKIEIPKPVDVPKPADIPKQDLSQIVPVDPTPLVKTEEPVLAELPKPEPVVEKVKMPTPIKIPEEEKIEDDDKDLDKIKSEIMRALSKLEQVEVE